MLRLIAGCASAFALLSSASTLAQSPPADTPAAAPGAAQRLQQT